MVSRQARLALPSTCSVQAPQYPAPQPNFVPVSANRSRRNESKLAWRQVSGTLTRRPLMRRRIVAGLLSTAINLAKQFGKQLVVKPNDDAFTNRYGRCAQVTRWPQHGGHRVLSYPLANIELRHFFTFGNMQRIRRFEQSFSVAVLQLAAGWNGFTNFDLAGLQKLGCFGAGGSALAEVVPVYFFGHVMSR